MPVKVDAKIRRAFAPIRRRLMVQHFIYWIFWGLTVAIGQSIIWRTVSFFMPIFYIVYKMIYTGGIIILVSFILAWMIRPSSYEMAGKVDRLGLQERITTAHELRERNDEFAKIQRQDALDRLKAFDPRTVTISIPKKSTLLATSMAVILAISFLIPNPQDRIIKERLHTKKIIEEQFERLEKDGADKLSKEAGLTLEEQEEIKKLLTELSTKLKKTQEYREAIKEISKTEEKLTEMIQEARQKKMVEFGEELSKQEALRPLGEKVKDMDAEGIKQEMEKLQGLAETEGLEREIMNAMQKALEQMAGELGEGKTKDQLMNIANEIGTNLDNDSINLIETLGELEAKLAEMSESPLGDAQDLMYALQDMKNKISQAGNQNIDQSQLAQSDQSDSQNSESNNSGENLGNTQDNTGQGQGNQSGSGQGNSGQPGQGQGNQGSLGGNGTGGNQGSGIGTAHPEYEKILNPKRLGDGGETSQVKGKINEQGSSQQVEAGEGLGSFDGFIPYNEVFGEYKSQAMQNIDRLNIPSNMREWVKGYFSSLE